MAYAVIDDVERAAGGRDKLKSLTDYDATGQVDTDVVDDAIAAADDMINSYAQHRYLVPFAVPVPGVITRMSAEEAVYRLRMNRESVTPLEQDLHVERMVWLRDLSMGIVSPGVDARPVKSSDVAPETGDRNDDADALTRVRFDGWFT